MSILSNAIQQAVDNTPKVGTSRLTYEQFIKLIDKKNFVNTLYLQFPSTSDEHKRLKQSYNNIQQRIDNHWKVA